MTREVRVEAYNKQWPRLFKDEMERILPILKDEIIAAHHIGSTSIPGMWAKPIIDILLEVKDIAKIDDYNNLMNELGYEPRGELGIPGRRYFSRESPVDVRTHHIHAFQSGDHNIERHLAFKEYMIAHPEDARSYSELKKRLAKKYPRDIDSYIAGKEKFVDEMESKAISWKRTLTR